MMRRKFISHAPPDRVQELAEFFTCWSEALFRYGCTLTPDRGQVEDAIQDLFMDLWRREVAVAAIAAPRAYLLTALRRILLRSLQRGERSMDLQAAGWGWEELVYEAPGPALAAQEVQVRACQEALASLPLRQREVINLRYYQGLSYREIAAVMQVETSSVGRFLDRALTSLRAIMPRHLRETLVSLALCWGWLGG